jgi:hypothetical protein
MAISKVSQVYLVAKLIVAAIFFVAGGICLGIENQCSNSQHANIIIISIGGGIVINTCLMMFGLLLLLRVDPNDKDYNGTKLFFKGVLYFIIIFIGATILMIVGGGSYRHTIAGPILLGGGIGIFMSAVISGIITLIIVGMNTAQN